MRKRKRSIRILSGILSMTTILGSVMGTGLTAYAEAEGNGYSLIKSVSTDETVLKNTWKKIDGKWYFFDEDGSMAVDRWVPYNGKWYYLGEDGAMVTGWKKIDGKWYFFGKDGSMAADRWVKDNGKWYYLGKSGAMRTGWFLYNDVWYFLKITGDTATDWKKIKGTWYYFDSDGRMYSNAYIDRQYFVDENGAWDGVTMTDDPIVGDIPGSEPSDPDEEAEEATTTLAFHQNGWYVARLEVQVWDKSKEDFVWVYSDSCARGNAAKVKIDTDKYEINRVGYQIWFFGWDNDYMNLPWANTEYATDFSLSGYGDYPEFTWK